MAGRLEAHHIDPLGDRDDPANGLTLCVPCHLAEHGNLKKRLSDPRWDALIQHRMAHQGKEGVAT